MSQKWKTLEEGIRVRYHATRKHGIKPDTYFTLRIQINGKRTEESLGWRSVQNRRARYPQSCFVKLSPKKTLIARDAFLDFLASQSPSLHP